MTKTTGNGTVENAKIAIIGLGYVGLPLAVEFSHKYPVVGFDINETRITELLQGQDRTREIDPDTLQEVISKRADNTSGLTLTSDETCLLSSNTYIITVPTPVDAFKVPDLSFLKEASATVGRVLKPGDYVIYESTVYPGCTEEDCVPVLEKVSGLTFNSDFFVGYSPERISPGDKEHTLTNIIKVTSGSTKAAADRIDMLYRSIITAGTHVAPSIKVAEAAKAVENAQRDVNISFVNELALIFDKLDINTYDVLKAAGTKWNYMKFKPGLVGGHCIGVDPYYLTHKAQSVGYYPQVILSGRRVNDYMGAFVAGKVVKLMIQKDHKIKDSRALIMGITFKENCPDIRNTRVIDIYHELVQFGLTVDIYDPWADVAEVKDEFGLNILCEVNNRIIYDAIVIAVAHNEFSTFNYQEIKRHNSVIFDAKALLHRDLIDGRL